MFAITPLVMLLIGLTFGGGAVIGESEWDEQEAERAAAEIADRPKLVAEAEGKESGLDDNEVATDVASPITPDDELVYLGQRPARTDR